MYTVQLKDRFTLAAVAAWRDRLAALLAWRSHQDSPQSALASRLCVTPSYPGQPVNAPSRISRTTNSSSKAASSINTAQAARSDRRSPGRSKSAVRRSRCENRRECEDERRLSDMTWDLQFQGYDRDQPSQAPTIRTNR